MQKEIRKKKCNRRYYVMRQEYINVGHDASQSYDKTIVSLSTAALGFLCGLIAYKEPSHFHYLAFCFIAGWLFICSVAFDLYSLWLRQDYCENGLYSLCKEYDPDCDIKLPNTDINAESNMVKAQRYSGFCFVPALLFIGLFVVMNYI